jgi:signal-transduction protein with cAMP-binding, CBS, and nucleotidyltransferase domain
MKIHEFMISKIEFIDADKSVYDAVEQMVDRRIRSLVVRFPGKDPDYGVLTSRDIVFRVFAKGIDPKKIKASEIASKPIACIDKDLDFGDAATIMERSNIARLFVCDRGKVIGLISLLDVLAAELVMRARGNHVS